jgi:hypothetical protein
MASSTNYGWAEPDNSSLVKNGASDIRTLGNAIDTSVWNIGFGQAGKNKLINGDFFINQRGFTSNTVTQTYNFDRWYQAFAGGSQTVTPQTFTAGAAPVAGYEGKNFVQVVTASQSAAGDYANYAQRIENVRTFAGQTTTVSFWAKAASGTPKVGVSGLQQFGTGGSPSGDVIITGSTVTLSTSWARYSVTLNVPSISGKTFGTTDNTSILRLDLWTSVGTTISGAGYPAVGIQNATIQFWGVQWEAGSIATPFQTATGTIQGELAACQRYYYRIANGQAYSVFGAGAGSSATVIRMAIPTHTTMRVYPTSVDYSGVTAWDYAGGAITFTSLALANLANNPDNPQIDVTGVGVTTHRPYYLVANNNANAYVGLSAEL